VSDASGFRAAEAYLLGTISETVSPRTSYKLDRMRALLDELGNPQNAYPTLHVGGTSGKGSTSTMLAAVLQASGKRTGLHTKPHFVSMTERARIDGTAVTQARFVELLDAMMPAIERVTAEFGRPTYYETLLALAFLHFARERAEVAVIEVGLGGRLDGTNVIVPQVAAITSVGFDHVDVLGNSLESIAAEKAGIAKPGVPLVVAVTHPQALATIERVAREAGAPVVRVHDAARIAVRECEPFAQAFDVTTARATYALHLPVLGTFQRSNAATAIVALEQLPGALVPSVAAVERGFAKLAIAGRMEVFPGRVPVVFDIAHNPEKAEHLVASLRESFAGRRIHYVVAIGESKDAREVLRALAELSSTFAFTAFAIAGRSAVPPAKLLTLAESLGIAGRAFADPFEAFAVARRGAASGDAVVVTGSTFIVATLREWWMAQVAQPSAR
jgi:dihydrofolate synthase / folylpolyglutamate synthase